jgi:hypothetical protein
MGDLLSPVIGSGSFVIGGLQILRFHRSKLFFTADFKSAGPPSGRQFIIHHSSLPPVRRFDGFAIRRQKMS